MQKPVYSSDEEQLLMTRLWDPSVKNDPEKFVMFAFPWGQKGTPLEHHIGPRKWQRRQLRKIAKRIRENLADLPEDVSMLPEDVSMLPEFLKPAIAPKTYRALRRAVASGRGIGKSALVAWLIIWMLTTRIGSTVVVSANTEAQLRTVTWGELTKWVTMAINAHWWEISATKLLPAQWLTELVERDLKKGSRYWAAEGKVWSEENPDGYAGVHNHDGMMVIFDEASGIPDSIWSVASGFFTEQIPDRYWLAFSNPRRNTGYFFECFNSKRDFWDCDQIDSRTVEGTDRAIYQQIIDEYGADSREARVEVYGEFPREGDDQFISPVMVDEAMKRKPYKDATAPVIIGIDPARGGADATLIIVRQGRDLLRILRYKGEDTMMIAGRIINAIEEYRPALTIIDEGGLGYGILDRLMEQRYKVRGVNFGWKSKNPVVWLNKRSEIWCHMRDWLRSAHLPNDRLLKTDLTGVHLKMNSTGAIQLESKKEMKARGLASPDSADALALTFAFPLAKMNIVNDQFDARHRSRAVHYQLPVQSTSWMGS